MAKIMKCGHAPNATSNDKPACAICSCVELDDREINLTGREATCTYCGKKQQSDERLAFFEHRPGQRFDKYYCGCFGWD